MANPSGPEPWSWAMIIFQEAFGMEGLRIISTMNGNTLNAVICAVDEVLDNPKIYQTRRGSS